MRRHAHCSWCYNKSYHVLHEKCVLSRNVYVCESCCNKTVECRYCGEMAKGEPGDKLRNELSGFSAKFGAKWNNELCAEHDGTIASFPNLTKRLSDITEYSSIFERQKKNLAKVTKYASFTVAGVAAIAGVAVTAGTGAGPIAAVLGNMGLLGAAGTGTAISTLSGAALTSASLAAIGGTMAAGIAIISASGLALGGVMGGVVANQYFSDDKSFAIRSLAPRRSESRIVFVNGFTQEKEDTFSDWKQQQDACDQNSFLYGLNWASKTRYDLGMAFSKGVGSPVAKNFLLKIAKKGGAKAASKWNPITWFALLADLIKNPWHSAMFRAARTGVQLAEAISRTTGQKFTLVGHSLGARVIYYALEALSTKDTLFVDNVILLGGAIGRKDKEGWERAANAVSGKIYNCFSKQDKILDVFYRTANAGLSDPIGVRPIDCGGEKIVNIDCSSFVESHMTWKEHYAHIHRLIFGSKD